MLFQEVQQPPQDPGTSLSLISLSFQDYLYPLDQQVWAPYLRNTPIQAFLHGVYLYLLHKLSYLDHATRDKQVTLLCLEFQGVDQKITKGALLALAELAH